MGMLLFIIAAIDRTTIALAIGGVILLLAATLSLRRLKAL
jgi:hypothetical protein